MKQRSRSAQWPLQLCQRCTVAPADSFGSQRKCSGSGRGRGSSRSRARARRGLVRLALRHRVLLVAQVLGEAGPAAASLRGRALDRLGALEDAVEELLAHAAAGRGGRGAPGPRRTNTASRSGGHSGFLRGRVWRITPSLLLQLLETEAESVRLGDGVQREREGLASGRGRRGGQQRRGGSCTCRRGCTRPKRERTVAAAATVDRRGRRHGRGDGSCSSSRGSGVEGVAEPLAGVWATTAAASEGVWTGVENALAAGEAGLPVVELAEATPAGSGARGNRPALAPARRRATDRQTDDGPAATGQH